MKHSKRPKPPRLRLWPRNTYWTFSKANSIGVDLSLQISYAKENYSGEFLSLDQFNYLDYEESFDIITVVGLFEFLKREDIDILLDQLHTMLKPKGRLIITTPNFSLAF